MQPLPKTLLLCSLLFMTKPLYGSGPNVSRPPSSLDNVPNECVGMVDVDGEAIEEALKKDPAWCKVHHCDDGLSQMKKNERRRKAAKTADEVGGERQEGNPEALRRMIDGPANLRDAPRGKILGSFPDNFIVLVTGRKGEWFLVRGYWERTCETGWTHKKNLRSVPR